MFWHPEVGLKFQKAENPWPSELFECSTRAQEKKGNNNKKAAGGGEKFQILSVTDKHIAPDTNKLIRETAFSEETMTFCPLNRPERADRSFRRNKLCLWKAGLHAHSCKSAWGGEAGIYSRICDPLFGQMKFIQNPTSRRRLRAVTGAVEVQVGNRTRRGGPRYCSPRQWTDASFPLTESLPPGLTSRQSSLFFTWKGVIYPPYSQGRSIL